MHDTRSKYREFARTIQAIFEEGLYISRDSLHFILSTIPISDIRELETFLRDPSNCESDSLVELIYFPNESIQLRLEDRLESEAFQQRDQPVILEYLLACRGKTLLRFADLKSVLKIQTLESGAQAFLERLNICKHLNPELREIIDRIAGKKQGRKYKVWLRNMAMDLHERDICFIKNLFLKMAARSTNFHEYLNFSLRFLEESENEADLLQLLTQHKARCLRHLRQSDRFEAYRREHTPETLMAQGIRIPHMDKKALLLQVALVDDICLALFNRSM